MLGPRTESFPFNNTLMVRIDSVKCTGCGACKNACAYSAISLIVNREGFLFPLIDIRRCVDCGLCVSVCPLSHPKQPRIPLKCFAARSKEEAILYNSSSGGVVSTIARNMVMATHGVVYGCVLDNLVARHVRVDTLDQLHRLTGSKYIQSDCGNAFAQCANDLRQGKDVLYIGTPCQISGLKSFLKKDYDNLLTIALICHGVGSPFVFQKYCREIGRQLTNKIIDFKFRDKRRGWRKSVNVAVLDDGSEIVLGVYDETDFGRAFISKGCLRKSCYNCVHKEGRHGADIVVGDFWGIERLKTRFNDDKGVSCVIVYSKKGIDAVSIDECDTVAVSYEDILFSNANFSSHQCDDDEFLGRDSWRSFFMERVEHESIAEIEREWHKGNRIAKFMRWLRHPLRTINGKIRAFAGI